MTVGPLRLDGDWHDGVVPASVRIEDGAYLETSYSLLLMRSRLAEAVRLGRGSAVYKSTMFDVGASGRVVVGRYALVHGARIICERSIEIGDYCLVSWNVVLMDSYRVARQPRERRRALRAFRPASGARPSHAEARPVRIGRNVWIGHEAVVLPGVTIGEGSVVGARSVVAGDVPAFCIVAGNPARLVRRLPRAEGKIGP